MKQNQHGEADAELHSPQGPVDPEEGGEAEKKFQLEQCREQHFALGGQHRNRAHRS